ncbi:amidohydrolase family protein [Desulfoscipio gibsoniae]|uniref:Putative TIM-barrel fold metal-dependent hydrolase n=1 Tax=Desulfoscipio gibsoniae DSM 7213 TaxID=767817 RepID=R4KP74_9FIRM|nr:amidohydrolase family protein [Desulfoscipio gibsoniae]AGL02375.1 putative TIM-barrel fold metal-dependent hydrolase [Desulfoscipio gibsoniae DSM 7213]
MIIDGHAHSCGEFFASEKIIAKLNELNVDKVVLCPGVNNGPKNYNYIPGLAKIFSTTDILLSANKIIKLLSKIQQPDDIMQRNEYVYSLYLKYPDRIIQFFLADPSSNQIDTDLHEKFNSWGFNGIKLHQCTQSFEYASPGLEVIINFAREKEIPIFIHLRSTGNILKFIDIARKYSKVNFIIAHLIGLESFIKHKTILNNLYFEISPAPLISLKRIYMAIDHFGAGKVILGSDTPFGKDNLRKNIEKVTQLNISDREKELILGGNLQRILKL